MAYKYLVLDSLGRPVARCMSPEGLDAPVWRLEMSEEDLERILAHKNVTLVGTSEKWAAAEGRIVRHDGNQVWVEAIRELDGTVRENLRMPVRFESFLYPVSGSWKGRRPIVSRDLSCGGVAFYCGRGGDRPDRGAGDLPAPPAGSEDPAPAAQPGAGAPLRGGVYGSAPGGGEYGAGGRVQHPAALSFGAGTGYPVPGR